MAFNVKIPPPDLFSPPEPASAPASVILNGLPFVSAALNVMLPVSLVNVIGSDDNQFANAPTVPPERLVELVNDPVPSCKIPPEPTYREPPLTTRRPVPEDEAVLNPPPKSISLQSARPPEMESRPLVDVVVLTITFAPGDENRPPCTSSSPEAAP